MKQGTGWFLLVIGTVVLLLTILGSAFINTVDTLFWPENEIEAIKELSIEKKTELMKIGEPINKIFTVLMGRSFIEKAIPVGYALGGSIVFAGLVIIVIAAVPNRKEKNEGLGE
jgi:hypothetical protein